MDLLTFISRIIESLAWPVSAILLGLVFRRRILELIPTLRKFKAGPLEAEFELATKEALASAEESTNETILESFDVPLEASSNDGSLVSRLRAARADPARSILEGWAQLDGELFRFGLDVGIGFAPVESSSKVYSAFIKSHLVPTRIRELVSQLHELRTQVSNGRVNPTSDAAQDYLLAIDRASELVRALRKKLSSEDTLQRENAVPQAFLGG